ncbi:MAG: dimethylamine/trimethylamine dehydrogenase, partial [Parvicella sp.]
TGASWRKDGYGRSNLSPITWQADAAKVFSPDDIMNDVMPSGNTVVYDDDNYYMASVIAEKILLRGDQVVYVTPGDKMAAWCDYTDEQHRVQKRLMELGVQIMTQKTVVEFDGKQVGLSCTYTEALTYISADNLVLVTARLPNDRLYFEVQAHQQANPEACQFRLSKIGDCDAPGIIADATFAGHRYARELDEAVDIDNPMKYDRVQIQAPKII